MPAKLDRCVADLMKKGKTEKQAYAICNAALKGDESSFDDATSHQVIHDEASSVSNCPVCNGSMSDKKKIKKYAMQIMTRKINQRHNYEPMMPQYEGKENHKFAEVFVPLEMVKGAEGEADQLPTEVMVVPVGQWNTGQYGKIQISEDHIKEMVKNFNDNIRVGVPIDVDHDAKGAAGWVKKLINKGKEGLWASIEWTTYGSQLLTDKIYRFFSPELSLDYVDPETSEYFGPVFIAGTLTNRPLFKELNPLMAHDLTKDLTTGIVGMIIKGSNMELKDLLAKDPATLNDEEKAFVKEHASELTDEQKKSFGVEEAPAKPEGEGEGEPAKPEGEGEPAKPEGGEGGEPVQGKEKDKTVTIKASELDAIKKMAEEGVKANRELLKMSVTKEVEDNYIFSEKGGKVAPKGKDALVTLLMSMTDDQKKLFSEVMEAIPAKKVFAEIGSGGEQDADTATGKVMAEAKKLMTATDGKEGLTFKEALNKIKKDQPDLYKEYMAERNK